MKHIILFIAFIGAVCSFPKGEDLQFKRVREPAENILPRIASGHEAVPHSIPYQAYIITTYSGCQKLSCSGSLISPKYVLTSASCIISSVSADIYLGVHNTEVPESSRILVTSSSIKIHEKYDNFRFFINNDIGLIELSTPVELNENVNVVALPRRGSNTNYEGANVRVSGWGVTKGIGKASPVLLEVNSTVISNEECNAVYSTLEESHVCISGSSGVGSCNSDAGGPLIAENVQIGIVTLGVINCEKGFPSVYTRVSSYLDWIEENTDLTF